MIKLHLVPTILSCSYCNHQHFFCPVILNVHLSVGHSLQKLMCSLTDIIYLLVSIQDILDHLFYILRYISLQCFTISNKSVYRVSRKYWIVQYFSLMLKILTKNIKNRWARLKTDYKSIKLTLITHWYIII